MIKQRELFLLSRFLSLAWIPLLRKLTNQIYIIFTGRSKKLMAKISVDGHISVHANCKAMFPAFFTTDFKKVVKTYETPTTRTTR
jgi:hypothetical protein